MNKYIVYVADTETTGLDPIENDIIELSLHRLDTGEQKTWCLKPFNLNAIQLDALRINGHKLEDITHQTKYGRETYCDPLKVIIEVENFVMQDNVPTDHRVLAGHNIGFDKLFIDQTWNKCNAKESNPFGRRFIDTMALEFCFNYNKNIDDVSYTLNSCLKKYGIKNDKAHSAESDTKAAAELLLKQLEFFK